MEEHFFRHRLLLLVLLISIGLNAVSQVPQGIPYQAVARNLQGQLLANKSISVRFSILDSVATGAVVYSETHSTTTSNLGLFNLNLGMGAAVGGTFSGISWGVNSKFLKVELDSTALGTSYMDLGTQQMMSVPYALYAKNSGGSSGSFTHYIGEEFGGGVIFHLWKDAQGLEHGLIVDKTDLSIGTLWSEVDNVEIGPSAQSSWDGLNNSNAIVAQVGHTNSAAALCLNSTNGGQNDWYLPSVDELSLLWHNRFNVSKVLSTIIGASVLPNSAIYWSSSEANAYYAWTFSFYGGDANYASNGHKDYSCYVRAVRVF